MRSTGYGIELMIDKQGNEVLYHKGVNQIVHLFEVTATSYSSNEVKHTRFVIAQGLNEAIEQAGADMDFPESRDHYNFVAIQHPLMIRGWGCLTV